MLRVHLSSRKISYPLAAFAALKAMVSENTPSRTQALLEVHLLAQCPITRGHTPTFSLQRGTLLCAAARFGRSSVCLRAEAPTLVRSPPHTPGIPLGAKKRDRRDVGGGTPAPEVPGWGAAVSVYPV